MEILILFMIGWYAIGLLGSHIIITKGPYFNWKEERVFGCLMAFGGIFNFIVALFWL